MVNLEKIYHSTIRLLIPSSLQETYMIVVNEAIKLVDAKYGSIFMPKDGKIVRVYTSDPGLNIIRPRSSGITENVFKTGEPRLLDIKKIAENHPNMEKFNVGSDITIPLAYGHIVIGVLSVLSAKGKRFDEVELHLMKLFGPIATLAIRNAILYQDLKDSLKMRDLFISMASHELRNPIASLSLNAELLERTIKKGRKTQLKRLNILQKEIDRIGRLVNDLLDLSQIERGEFSYNFKRVNPNRVVKETVEEFKMHKDRVTFNDNALRNKMYIKGDEDKLLQMLKNIISNSLKFSPDDKKVSIKTSKDGAFFRIDVKDLGVGISKEDMHIFKQFYQGGDGLQKNKPGLV